MLLGALVLFWFAKLAFGVFGSVGFTCIDWLAFCLLGFACLLASLWRFLALFQPMTSFSQ